MRHRWAALVVVLALGALAPGFAEAQGSSGSGSRRDTASRQSVPVAPQRSTVPDNPSGRSPGFELGQNFPNPFNPTTTIPFTIGDFPTCTDPGRQHRVSLRIYNVIGQLVAVPILQGGDGAGQPMANLQLRCGSYTAWWNGNYLNTSQEVASGIYLYRIEVDGKVATKKMLVLK